MSDLFSASSCKICFDNYDGDGKKPELMVPCGHTFCKECLWKLLTPECPTCKVPYKTTVTVWDLIPAGANEAGDKEVQQSSLETELASFKTLLEYVGELNEKECELTAAKIGEAEALINGKAEEVINRVIDEQNCLLHRVKMARNFLEKRNIRNSMMESFAKKQFELISLQAAYNSQLKTEQLSDHGLLKEVKQEMSQLKSLKANIEEFIKSSKPVFTESTDQSTVKHLVGQVLLPDAHEEDLVKDTVKSSQAKLSKLNPDAAPFDANQLHQRQPATLGHPVQQQVAPTRMQLPAAAQLNPVPSRPGYSFVPGLAIYPFSNAPVVNSSPFQPQNFGLAPNNFQ